MELKNNILLEACVGTLDEALLAQEKGANRVEVCSRLDLDGLTPNDNFVKNCINNLSIPIKVMVRPRAGNFVYSENELLNIQQKIMHYKSLGVGEVVFGILNKDNEIDVEALNKLAKVAYPMNVTFHKAIDKTKDLFSSLQKIMSISEVSSVLTSGGESNARNGYEIIRKMIDIAQDQITIIAAGSITDQNIGELHNMIGANEYHGKKIVGNLN